MIEYGDATFHIGDSTIPVTDFRWNFEEAPERQTDPFLRVPLLSDFQAEITWSLDPVEALTLATFIARMLVIYRREPRCACHPAPNPAARDYRRRTKHRNRRGA